MADSRQRWCEVSTLESLFISRMHFSRVPPMERRVATRTSARWDRVRSPVSLNGHPPLMCADADHVGPFGMHLPPAGWHRLTKAATAFSVVPSMRPPVCQAPARADMMTDRSRQRQARQRTRTITIRRAPPRLSSRTLASDTRLGHSPTRHPAAVTGWREPSRSETPGQTEREPVAAAGSARIAASALQARLLSPGRGMGSDCRAALAVTAGGVPSERTPASRRLSRADRPRRAGQSRWTI